MRKLFPLLLIVVATACSQQEPSQELHASDILHENQDLLTQVIIYDVFSPPVASRLYVYSSLAAYEAVRFSRPGTISITDRLRDFGPMPSPDPAMEYDFTLAASKAFFNVVRNVKVFSVDSLNNHEDRLYGYFREKLGDSVYLRSVDFGDSVAKVILARARGDGYFESRAKPKYIGIPTPGKWVPTPPDYLDAIEWCWSDMKTMVLDSASQLRSAGPPPFSLDTASIFYQGMKEVHSIYKNLTPEQIDIADYWDDNPMVIMHSGHLMFSNKKITPGGHWMGISAIASKMKNADPVKTAAVYALTAIALYDGFIACWDEKYRYSYVRPVTIINEALDATWMPYLQTPPFPEYPSGHSTITAAAAEVLTSVYGENFAFRDTSDLRYIGMERNFNSFREAAAEASISRLYGGIHYRFSIDAGVEIGMRVGELINSRLLTSGSLTERAER